MFNFFANSGDKIADGYRLSGNDYNHIKNVLRMNKGDKLLVSCEGKSDLCVIETLENDCVNVKVIDENVNNTELPIEIILFQALPKSDKMELIIQKSVELGVSKIVPVEMKNCVVKLDEKKKNSKITRWQAISESAAKQSKRNIIPQIGNVISFSEMISNAQELDLFLVPYENKEGMTATREALENIKSGMKIGILIGPEGGFDVKEIEKATEAGGTSVSLGKRILRTETAAITAVSLIMLYTEMNLGGEEF